MERSLTVHTTLRKRLRKDSGAETVFLRHLLSAYVETREYQRGQFDLRTCVQRKSCNIKGSPSSKNQKKKKLNEENQRCYYGRWIRSRPERTLFFRHLDRKLARNARHRTHATVHSDPMPEELLYQRAREIVMPRMHLPWGKPLRDISLRLTTKGHIRYRLLFQTSFLSFFWLFPANHVVVLTRGGGERLSREMDSPALRVRVESRPLSKTYWTY